MVYTRSELKCKKPHNKTLFPPTTTNIFKTLISALESPEGIKAQLLKSSYYLLIQLYSKQQLCLGKGADLNELFMKTKDGEVRLSLRDVYTFSNFLFKDLQRRLKQLHSSKHDVSASRSLELEELNLLIRCCMVTLNFRGPQQHFLESGRILLLIFKKLSLLEVAGSHGNVDFKKSNSCQCMYGGEKSSESFSKVASLSSLELFESCVPAITTILEVLIDELLVHSRLRTYFHIVDSFSSPEDRLFKHGANSGDFGVIMEMICSHFLLTISSEGALQEFLNTITWVRSNNSKSLEISVIAAGTLLQNPIVLSSPKLLQAHIVSLVSDVIGVCVYIERMTSDPRFLDSYLSVFESSVILYTQHMSILKIEKHSTDANESSHPSFELFIDPAKWRKLNQMITTLNDSWNSNLRREFFKRKSDLVASSIEYIHKSLCILDIECRDDVLSFLRFMLMRAANDVNNIELPLNSDASLQDICLLASLLMLISNSLIQVVWCLRYGSDQPKSLKDLSVCKEYDIIMGIINRFKEFSIRLPIQKFSYNMMEETCSTSHKESRLMLLHFLGLLSLSFDSGVDFLVKSCISVIMALTNLFILEEGNIDALMSLVGPNSLPSEGSLVIYKEALVSHYPTLRIAAKFQEIRTLYVSNASITNDSVVTEDVGSVAFTTEECVEETCRGETYLKMRLEGSHGVDDFDDLADFVECKKGKDYVGWLKSRDKFRERKLGKGMKRRWEKKKQAWRSMKGKT